MTLRPPGYAHDSDDPAAAAFGELDLFALAELERTGTLFPLPGPRPVPAAPSIEKELPVPRSCPACGRLISPFAVRCEFCNATVPRTAGPNLRPVRRAVPGTTWLTKPSDLGWKIAAFWLAAQATASIGLLFTYWGQFQQVGGSAPATEPSGTDVLMTVFGTLLICLCCLVIGLQLFVAWGLWNERSWARAVVLGLMALLPVVVMIILSVTLKSHPLVVAAALPLVAGFALLLIQPNNWRVLLACVLLLMGFGLGFFGH
jgi:hypothetical protein